MMIKRRREAPAAEYPITDCALVWVSVHGPESFIYTHKPRASRKAREDILSKCTQREIKFNNV